MLTWRRRTTRRKSNSSRRGSSVRGSRAPAPSATRIDQQLAPRSGGGGASVFTSRRRLNALSAQINSRPCFKFIPLRRVGATARRPSAARGSAPRKPFPRRLTTLIFSVAATPKIDCRRSEQSSLPGGEGEGREKAATHRSAPPACPVVDWRASCIHNRHANRVQICDFADYFFELLSLWRPRARRAGPTARPAARAGRAVSKDV